VTSSSCGHVEDAARARRQRQRGRGQVPQWLELDVNGQARVIRSLPLREDIQIPVSEQLIVELYSK
jgi:ribosomal protein S4